MTAPRTHACGCALRTGNRSFPDHRPPAICDCGLWEEDGDPRLIEWKEWEEKHAK